MDLPASSSVRNSVSVIPRAVAATSSGETRRLSASTEPELLNCDGGGVSSEVDTSITWGADDGPDICALAKLVMPRVPAPTATTRPADTAILLKRDVVFMMEFFLWVVHQVSLAVNTFAPVGKKSP
jgi:hypothetical protein